MRPWLVCTALNREDGVQTKTAIIYVETIAGVGHMPIASYLTHALAEKGMDVHILASAHSHEQASLFDFGDARWHILPTFLKDPVSGKAELTENGLPYKNDPAFQALRASAIRQVFEDLRPDVLITETWPLGKGHFDAEMIPAIENSRDALKNCKLFSIGRDVMNYPNHRGAGVDSDLRAVELLNTYFDGLIITGDDRLFTMDQSFQHAEKIRIPVHYAGYFAPAPFPPLNLAPVHQDVLIATGGRYSPGETDAIVMDAIRARRHTVLADRRWCFFLSDGYPAALREEAVRLAGREAPDGGIVIGDLSREFRRRMSDAGAVIIAGGLNSTMESLNVRTVHPLPIVITPIGVMPNKPCEQVTRTLKLAAMGIVGTYMPENHGRPDVLAKIFNHEVLGEKPALVVNSRGAEMAAAIIAESVYELPFAPMPHAYPQRLPPGMQPPANEENWRLVM